MGKHTAVHGPAPVAVVLPKLICPLKPLGIELVSCSVGVEVGGMRHGVPPTSHVASGNAIGAVEASTVMVPEWSTTRNYCHNRSIVSPAGGRGEGRRKREMARRDVLMHWRL